ncbi:MAG: hypothetical protein QG620_606 [Patescibacteria group bacterium]|nr:hypothetical protein [Patescibacteria group bacterium]
MDKKVGGLAECGIIKSRQKADFRNRKIHPVKYFLKIFNEAVSVIFRRRRFPGREI